MAVERRTAAVRVHAYVVVTGALANLSQLAVSSTLVDAGVSVLGLSGAVFALLGYVVTGNRLSALILDRFVPRSVQHVIYVILPIVVTMMTAAPGVAIVGHFVGLFLGLVGGAARVLRS